MIIVVLLSASCQRGSVRIIVGDGDEEFYTMSNSLQTPDYESEFTVIDDMLSRGRIEVCNGSEYETVCDDGWNYTDASVVCRELGFSPYGILMCVTFYPIYICLYMNRSHSFGR